ncbi:Isochorismatase family protein YecD, partial [Lachnellula arida]
GHPGPRARLLGLQSQPGNNPPGCTQTQIHASLAPRDGDLCYRKIRFGSFMRGPSRGLLDEWRDRGVENVVVGGVVTSGAVLSAVRQLADLDFRLLVLEDCCADYDAEVHGVLCEKVFPRQARVIKSSELGGLF